MRHTCLAVFVSKRAVLGCEMMQIAAPIADMVHRLIEQARSEPRDGAAAKATMTRPPWGLVT